MLENMKAEFYQLCSAIGRLYVDVKVLSPSLHRGGHQGEGVLQHPRDHLLGEECCWFDLPSLEGCGNKMWAGQCHTIFMAFQHIFTRIVEMGLV